jgi:hypothetical protein
MGGLSRRERSRGCCDCARLARFDGPERFDILPLLVCTDGAVSMFGRDVRRLRPNLLIGGLAAAAGRRWTGATLRLPHANIGWPTSAAVAS